MGHGGHDAEAKEDKRANADPVVGHVQQMGAIHKTAQQYEKPKDI
jgi:hypothetical protein